MEALKANTTDPEVLRELDDFIKELQQKVYDGEEEFLSGVA
jgi:hypothetical protein